MPTPTLTRLRQLNPGMSDAEIQQHWSTAHPDLTLTAEPKAAEPSFLDRLKGGAKSALDTVTSPAALGMAGAYGLDALATGTGNPELIPAANAVGNAGGNALGRLLHGEHTSLADLGKDAAIGGATTYIAPAAKALGKGASAVINKVPAIARGFGYASHPAYAALEAAGPVLTKIGEGADWLGNKLMAPFQPEVDAAVAAGPKTIKGVTGPLSVEVPYRQQPPVGFEPTTPTPSVKKPVIPSNDTSLNSVNDMMTNKNGVDWMNKEYDANKTAQEFADEFGMPAATARHEALKAGIGNPRVVEPLYSPQSKGSMSEVDAILEKAGLGKPSAPAAPSAEYTGRSMDEWPDLYNLKDAGDATGSSVARSTLDKMGIQVPGTTKVPMGATGDEMAGVKPFNPANELTPEESSAAPEFWDSFINDYFKNTAR